MLAPNIPQDPGEVKHPEPIADLDRRAKQGITSLLLRQGLIQIATFAGGVVLARLLTPSQFGLFAIATFLVSLFAVLGDLGLAASLIQRRNDLTNRDLSVAFTLEQISALSISCVLFCVAPILVGLFRNAPPGTVWLVRVLVLSFYLTSWRSISVLQLERQLRFKGLARIEALEVILYQFVAAALALKGLGTWSLVVAVSVRTLVGVVCLYLLAPYPVRLCLDTKLAKQILRFGFPFQSQTIMNSLGGWVLPCIGGVFLGPSGVGLLTWASANGRKPLLVVDSVMRVAFPHFSRLQQEKARLEETVDRYLTYLILSSNLWFALVLTAGPSLVTWIYTSKWLPGLLPLDLFALSLVFDVTGWVTGLSVNALGSVGDVTRLTMLRTIITLLLSVPFVVIWGLAGIPGAYLLGSAAIIPGLVSHMGAGALRRLVTRLSWVTLPLTGAILIGLATSMWIGLSAAEHGIITTFSVIAAYVTVSYITAPDWLKGSLRSKSRKFILHSPLPRRAV